MYQQDVICWSKEVEDLNRENVEQASAIERLLRRNLN